MTRPILAIGPLTNLQDARSSAAVGFGIISFSLERGQMRMLGSNLIWNISSWLSGPEILIELNAASLAELDNLGDPDKVGGILFPVPEVDSLRDVDPATLPTSRLILRVDENAEIREGIRIAESLGYEVELLATCADSADYVQEFADQAYLHFNHFENAQSFVRDSSWTPKGLWLREEAEEEFGQLDYEAIDEWIELINDRWEEE